MTNDELLQLIKDTQKVYIDLSSKVAFLNVRVDVLISVLSANNVSLDGLEQKEGEKLQALLDRLDAGVKDVADAARLDTLRQMLEAREGTKH